MSGTQPKGVADAGAYPYTAGSPGTLVDLLGVREVSHTTVTTEWDNKGDDQTMAAGADLDGLDLTVTLAAANPASLAAIAGGTVTTGGIAPAAVTTYVINADDNRPYVQIKAQARAKDADGGMHRVTYHQAAWRGGPNYGLAIDAFAEVSFTLRALPDENGDIFTAEIFEDYTALA